MTGVALAFAALLPLAVAAMLPRWRRAAEPLVPWSALPSVVVALSVGDAEVDLPWVLTGARIGVDGTGRVFLFFTGLLWFAAGRFALRYLRDDARRCQFLLFFLLAMSGNLGVAVAQDMLSFYLFFALMSFASYGLIVHNRDTAAVEAGRIYMVLVVLGEALFFAGIAMVGRATGEVGFSEIAAHGDWWARAPLVVGLLAVGLSIKVGAIPLHVWLPLAHPAAPSPASAVLSGAMIKAGLLGWLRFLPIGQGTFADWGTIGVVIGFAAAYGGVIAGLVQRDAKTALAYSSISQMGLITVMVGLGLAVPEAWQAALPAILVYALHHALAKASLFLGVGVAGSGSSSRRGRLGVTLGMLLPALALAGAPLTSGAIAKISLKHATAAVPQWADLLDGLLTAAAVGTALLMGRVLYLARPRVAERGHRFPAGMWRPWLLLLVAVAAFPALLPRVGLPVPEAPLAPASLWSALWPLALGVGLVAIFWRRDGWPVPWWIEVPPGDLLAVLLWVLRAAARRRAAIGVGLRQPWRSALAQRVSEVRAAGRRKRGSGDWPAGWFPFGLSYLLIALVLILLLTSAGG